MSTVVLVLIDVLVVIALSRLLGTACRWMKQPLVIGEIMAGILLGPSCLGILAPDLMTALFPQNVLPILEFLSQLGLIFFMFLIGLELDPKYLKGQLNIAILVSHVSILLPFSLGTLSAIVLYSLLSDSSVSFTAFALFLGSALSITAFPVLARIITENNLQSTRLGTLALTCAAVDDVTAWCLLAVSIAVTRTNSVVSALPTLFYSVLFIAFMFGIARYFLRSLPKYYERIGHLSPTLLACIYIGIIVSALITETIGIHLIFGAFLLGAVLPKHAKLTRELAEKTEDFVLIVLLPVFFAYSGLRTEVGLLNQPILWGLCGLVLLTAVIGKYVGGYGAARFCGLDHRESAALGWMMNTRGLTELIVLNIGLSLHVISPVLFTILVIMALTTTFMTSPLLEWCYPKQQIRETQPPDVSILEPTYRILVPTANPATQQGLLKLAAAIASFDHPALRQSPAAIYPLTFIENEEDYAYKGTPREANRLIAQQRLRLENLLGELFVDSERVFLHPIVQLTSDIARETASIVDSQQINLVIVGWHRPSFTNNRLGGRVGKILSSVKADVAVYVQQQSGNSPQFNHKNKKVVFQEILVPYTSNGHNDLALELAIRLLLGNASARLSILRMAPDQTELPEFSFEMRSILTKLDPSVNERISQSVILPENPIQAVVEASKRADLTIAGASREWGLERQTLGQYADALANQCCSSLLITRRYSRNTAHLEMLLDSEGTADLQSSDLPLV